jgi:hypothetical protein
MGFLERPMHNLGVAVPMALIALSSLLWKLSKSPVHLLTGSLFMKNSVEKQLNLFFYYFIALQVLVFFVANADINSRQASTSPFYFWFFVEVT